MIPEKLKYSYQKDLLIKHLCGLSDDDKFLRFGYHASVDYILSYVEKTWDEKGNRWFGVFDEDKLVASLHCAMIERTGAEMGCTVDPEYRGNGYGQALFDRGLTWCRSNGANHIYMHCLTQNKVIQHIAKKNGMNVIPQGWEEKEAHLKFDRPDYAAPMHDVICDRIAAVDEFYRSQRQILKTLLTPLNISHGKAKNKNGKKPSKLHSSKKG